MNEHIKSLLLNSRNMFVNGVTESNNKIYIHGSEENLEKFAELLIRECVGVADDYVKDCTCDEHINCKHPQSAIGRKIQEHFGVKR